MFCYLTQGRGRAKLKRYVLLCKGKRVQKRPKSALCNFWTALLIEHIFPSIKIFLSININVKDLMTKHIQKCKRKFNQEKNCIY